MRLVVRLGLTISSFSVVLIVRGTTHDDLVPVARHGLAMFALCTSFWPGVLGDVSRNCSGRFYLLSLLNLREVARIYGCAMFCCLVHLFELDVQCFV